MRPAFPWRVSVVRRSEKVSVDEEGPLQSRQLSRPGVLRTTRENKAVQWNVADNAPNERAARPQDWPLGGEHEVLIVLGSIVRWRDAWAETSEPAAPQYIADITQLRVVAGPRPQATRHSERQVCNGRQWRGWACRRICRGKGIHRRQRRQRGWGRKRLHEWRRVRCGRVTEEPAHVVIALVASGERGSIAALDFDQLLRG
mmetsp:Transcript_113328/g.320744  ORF Transcript_113328/g.320744 Transcript_113328/m.320744 type:complete len:201 (+) Transcript_113328:421-1023(+)